MDLMSYKLKNKGITKKSKEIKNQKYKQHKSNITTGEMWICDFETLTIHTEKFKQQQDTEVILWCVRRVNAQYSEYPEVIEYKTKIQSCNGRSERQTEVYKTDAFVCGTDGQSFIDFVLNTPKNATFYFHNLKYDGTFIIPLLTKDKRVEQAYFTGDLSGIQAIGYEEETGKLKNGYWEVFRDGKKIFNIRMRKYGVKNPISIEFRCTALMLSSSVKALGDALGAETFYGLPLKKYLQDEQEQNEDFYNVEPCADLEEMKEKHKDFFNYCLRDVEIVRRHMLYFQDMINTLPTVQSVVNEKKAHNERQKEKIEQAKKEGKKIKTALYKEDCNFNIWGACITIAGAMRKMLREIYIPTFQAKNKEYAANRKYRHNKHKYGNFAVLDYETHCFFTEPHNLFNESVSSNSKIFRGGFTQFNPALQNINSAFDCGDCGKWDVSSAYPYQMTFPLPFGELIEPEDFEEYYSDLTEEQYYEFLIIPIDEAIPKENAKYCATLPNLTEQRTEEKQKYRYSNQTQTKFTLAVLKQEWEELQHWYDFKVSNVYETQRKFMLAAPFLKGVAEELYTEKDRFARENKPAQKQGVKIAINSVYGSMGIKAEFGTLIYMEPEIAQQLEQIRAQEIDFSKGGSKTTTCTIRHISEHLNTKYTAINIKEHKEIKECWNVAAAAVITALERVYLMQTIRTIGAQYFAYCDTDSIIFANMEPKARAKMELLEKHTPHEFLDIGRWECEYRYIKGFIPHKAKEYIQIVYRYDEKNKCFLDHCNNPCLKEDAATFKKNAGAGFSLPSTDTEQGKAINNLFYMSVEERKNMTDEEIKSIYKHKTDLDNDFINRIKNSNTLIIKGNKITLSYPSGDVIVWEDKWTKYGVI